jgi:hypothetical protein
VSVSVAATMAATASGASAERARNSCMLHPPSYGPPVLVRRPENG